MLRQALAALSRHFLVDRPIGQRLIARQEDQTLVVEIREAGTMSDGADRGSRQALRPVFLDAEMLDHTREAAGA